MLRRRFLGLAMVLADLNQPWLKGNQLDELQQLSLASPSLENERRRALLAPR
jgi:hypothetical protein